MPTGAVPTSIIMKYSENSWATYARDKAIISVLVVGRSNAVKRLIGAHTAAKT